MKLFGKKEKKSCCCDENHTQDAMQHTGTSDSEAAMQHTGTSDNETVMKILGSGCAKCNQLEQAVKSALLELGMDTSLEHVTDFTQIAAYGVMALPAFVINEKVVSSGRILSVEEAKTIIEKNYQTD